MNRTDLLQLIANGENSRVEFKRDDVQPGKVATEMAGLLNHEGGHVLLGVEDDGTVLGMTRAAQQAEEWVMQMARDHLLPPVIPTWELGESEEGVVVGILTVPANAPDKPYKVKQGSHWVTKVRVGTTTRDATREEEQRLYQHSGGLRYGLKPVPGASVADLDGRRLRDYFVRIRGDEDTPSAADSWRRLLCNLLVQTRGAGCSATWSLRQRRLRRRTPPLMACCCSVPILGDSCRSAGFELSASWAANLTMRREQTRASRAGKLYRWLQVS